MISVTPRKTLILGFHFSKFGCCKPTTFPKELHHGCFSSSVNFFRIDKKTTPGEQFRKYQVKKLSSYYRRRVEGQQLQWNCKRNQSEPLRKLCCRYFYNLLEQFCLNGVLMGICQLLWLLRSGKAVGYKEEISITNPWILKDGEALANKGC